VGLLAGLLATGLFAFTATATEAAAPPPPGGVTVVQDLSYRLPGVRDVRTSVGR